MSERPDQWYQDALDRKRRKAETIDALQGLIAFLIAALFYGGIAVVVVMGIIALGKYIGLWGGF